jgi:hypothetical protein
MAPEIKVKGVVMNKKDPIVSTLAIDNVSGGHSGNYSCAPSNARPASIMVHVVDGKNYLFRRALCISFDHVPA